MEKIEVVYIGIECAYDSAQAKSQFDMPNGDKDQHFSIELKNITSFPGAIGV